MEKYIDVIHQSTELLETVKEGLLHIQKLINEGKYEASIQLFENVVLAFSTIEKSLDSLPGEVLSDEVDQLTTNVRIVIELVVDAYETKQYDKVQEILQFKLIPRFNKWQGALDEVFKPYIIS